MQINDTQKNSFLKAVREVEPARLLAPGYDRLLLHREGDWEVHWAPFEPLNTQAEIVLVGLTPGYSQALKALHSLRGGLRRGMSASRALVEAKIAGAFAGDIRDPLERMLNFMEIPQRMGVRDAASLLDQHGMRVHLTSALRYPVFKVGEDAGAAERKGYSGAGRMLRTPWMRQMVETLLADELLALPNARVFPMGQPARAAVEHLVARGVLSGERVYYSMQHPSPGNRMDSRPFVDPREATTAPDKQGRMARVARERAEMLDKLARDWPLEPAHAA
jgi:hypothetical protein